MILSSAHPNVIEENIKQYGYEFIEMYSVMANIKDEILVYGFQSRLGADGKKGLVYLNFNGEILHTVELPFRPIELYALSRN